MASLIHPDFNDANWQRYELLSTYDIAKINAGLGTSYTTLGEVHRAQAEAFAQLSPVQVRQDEKLTRVALGALSSQAAAANRR